MQIPRKLLFQVADYLDGNTIKAQVWFQIPNPHLNGLRPQDYYRKHGGWALLEKIINKALKGEENERIDTAKTCT